VKNAKYNLNFCPGIGSSGVVLFCGLQAFYNWEVARDVKNYLTFS
jgi:hypothetical protein